MDKGHYKGQMSDREAMKMALEALECHVLGFDQVRKMELAIEALEQALEQPEREWVGLTDEEIDHIWGITKPDYEDLFDLPRAIEAKLRAKNGF